MTKQDPHTLLQQASEIIGQRGQNYGQIEDNFQLIADLSSLRLGRDFHPYEIAVIMACVKNARSFATPDHMDSHLDSINYEAFAAVFAPDYVKQRSETPEVELGYQRKADRKPASITTLKTKTSPKIAINLDALEDEIVTPV